MPLPTIATQIRSHLADPTQIDQGNRNTCGAATIEYLLATEDPAGYARLAADLADDGQARLRNGKTLTVPRDAWLPDGSGRDDVERLMQAAFQAYGPDPRGRYANGPDATRWAHADGLFAQTVGRAIDWLLGTLGAQQGIPEGQVLRLYEDVLGRPAHLAGGALGGLLLAPRRLRAGVFDEVAGAVAKGERVPVDLVLDGLNDAPGGPGGKPVDQGRLGYAKLLASHQVLVTAIDGDQVRYRNPWGYETAMPLAEFRSRLTDAIIPE